MDADMTLPDLGARIAAATHLDPIARAKAVRDLAPIAKTVLAAEQDRAIFEATQEIKHEEVARQLEVGTSEIGRRVTEHRRRAGLVARRGRPARQV